MKQKKATNYGVIEKSLEKKQAILYGGKLRNGKNDKVFCKFCDYENGISCFYDAVAKDSKVDTKYPCGKAKAIYDAKVKK